MTAAFKATGYAALALLPIYAMWTGMQGPSMQAAVAAAGVASVGLALVGTFTRNAGITKRCWALSAVIGVLAAISVLLAGGVEMGTALGLALVVGALAGLSGLLARNAAWALDPGLRPTR